MESEKIITTQVIINSKDGYTQLEQTLVIEREFTAEIIDNVDAVILLLDSQGRFVRANRFFQQLFGYELEDLKGKFTWEILIQPDEVENAKNKFCPSKKFKGKRQYKQIWLTSDGIPLTIAWSITLLAHLPKDDGKYLINGIDVSAHDEVESLLEREHMLLQSLVDSIQDLIFYKDINSVYLGCNRAFEAYSGRKMKEYQGETDASFYPPETAKDFLDTDRHVIETGQDAIYENWTTDPAGEPILLETRKTPYRGPDGKILGVIGIGRDITRHRMAEEALQKANSEIEQLISSLSSILIGLTPAIHVTMWNSMAHKIFGIPSSFASGKYLGELGIQWEWNEIKKAIDRCEIENRSIFMDPIRFKRGDGREGFLGINVSPIHVRMMLTGHADLGTAINAINQGRIFRLLTKPCAPDSLVSSLDEALDQYRLLTAERDLLEKTLSNTVKLLSEVLSLTNPMAFSRTLRLRRIVRQVAANLRARDAWQFELAAMLSQIGCVTLPTEILEKIYAGAPLTKNEQSMFASHPLIGYKLLVNIPRLEVVASIIKDQQKPFEEYPQQIESGDVHKISMGAQILKVALDYDQLIHNDVPHVEAVKKLQEKSRQYNPEIVIALGDKEIITGGWLVKLVDSESAEIGMIVDEDIHAKNGGLVMAKGHEMSMASLERLQQLAKGIGVIEPFRVLVPWQSVKQKGDDTEEKNRAANG